MTHFLSRILMLFFVILGSLAADVSPAEDQRRQVTLPPAIPKIHKPVAASLPPQAPKVWDASVTETQRELQDILQIHQTLQLQQQAQLREIQRITERARIHQEILKGLEAQKPAAKSLEETLRIQKVTLIQKEARKNRARLKRLERKAAQEKALKEASLSEIEEPSTPSPPEQKEKEKKSFWWWDQKK